MDIQKTPIVFYSGLVIAFLALALGVFWILSKIMRSMKFLSSGMKTSDTGKSLIKELEGLRLTAYKDTSGILTIGYGHTGNDVFSGKTITKAEAETLLNKDVISHEKAVQNLSVKLNQNQFDALSSFVFNIGETKFLSSTLRKKVLVNPDDPTIADEFRRWKYDASKNIVAGLVNRREKEVATYFA